MKYGMKKQKGTENTEHSNERENVLHSVTPNDSEVQPESHVEGKLDARRALTKKQIVKACHYREIGLSINEIAEIMGLSPTTVYRITKDVQPINPKQEDDVNSPGPKSLSEKDLPSA